MDKTAPPINCNYETFSANREPPLGDSDSLLPFPDRKFDGILACLCYYCDEGETLADNLAEHARVLKPEGWLVAPVACTNSYIFQWLSAAGIS